MIVVADEALRRSLTLSISLTGVVIGTLLSAIDSAYSPR